MVCLTLKVSIASARRATEPAYRCLAALVALFLFSAAESPGSAAELSACRTHFQQGAYRECIKEAAAGLEESRYGEDWPEWKARAELALGEYDAALKTAQEGLKRYSWSVRLRLLAHEAALRTGALEEAAAHLKEIDTQATKFSWRYTDAEDLVALGRSAMRMRADAREVLEKFFDRARQRDPKNPDPLIAGGELALSKSDLSLAAEFYREALKLEPENPDALFGLARSLIGSDGANAQKMLAAALEKNPRHIPALLLMADRLIDAEEYDDARTWLDRVVEVNPTESRAWAYRAALAHIKHDPRGAAAHRTLALSTWPRDPQVDHIIGKKLSQKYRFAEGAGFQRAALEFDSRYLPARIQLAQDFLRLGREDQGWKQAETVYKDDGYDVVTFNLVELRDRLAEFRTLQDDHFVLRMPAGEAAAYGQSALQLLNRARETLGKKYGFEQQGRVTIEIFPDPNDFAVRTFGMPATSGYLGVCFGKVITANSPASQGENPSNWQAVLWHEYCHVVTLELTANRIPRWLSEGISVYEEGQSDSTWGQSMSPEYRKLVLEGKMTPIHKLSSAFLNPETPWRLQFAYYQSSLVVDFLVKEYGLDALRLVLRDLRVGIPINTALPRHTDSLADLEKKFTEFAETRARALGDGADWEEPDLQAFVNDDGELLAEWVKEHPDNYYGLALLAQRQVKDEAWKDAEASLQRLIALYPQDTRSGNPSLMLAAIYKRLGRPEDERAVLAKYVTYDADALEACLRLIELASQAKDWPSVRSSAARGLAVNPLLPALHRARAEAAEELSKPDESIASYRALLALEPEDPAEVHYRLARLLHRRGDAVAKRHVLAALEEAPRFRKAHKLLLEITKQNGKVSRTASK